MILFKAVLAIGFLGVAWWVRDRMHHVFRKNLTLLAPNDDDYQNEELWGVVVSYAQRAARKKGRDYSRVQCAQLLLASHYDETRSVSIALLLILCIFSYTPVSVRVVQMFVCQNIEGVRYLSVSDVLRFVLSVARARTVCLCDAGAVSRLTCALRATASTLPMRRTRL